MKALNGNLIEFGEFRLDTEKKILWNGAEVVALPMKAIELLCVLVENCGEVLGKDVLMDTVWADSFVEESVLTQNVYLLRKTLKELGDGDSTIKNIPRRGYMFSGEIHNLETQGTDLVIERHLYEKIEIEESEKIAEERLLLPAKPGTEMPWVAFAALLIAVLAGGGFFLWNSRNTETIRTLAVLPLKQFGGTVGDESLNLRITDSLITKIGNLKQISVRPTASIVKFTDDGISAVEIGKMLEVDAVLDGRFQQEGENLRINLQMISVTTGEQIWSGQFDGKTSGLLHLQDAVSAKLMNQLDLPLSKEQETAFVKQPTSNSKAFEEYSLGRYFWNKRTPESLKSAITSYQNAIGLDPEFAEAYVGLADSHFLMVDYSYDTSPDNVVAANENLARAIELNPNLADAYTTRGLIQTAHEWKWEDAEQSFLKAIDLAPNSSNAHHRYAMLLLKLRRFDEAETTMLRAKQLDPTSPGINMNLGVIYYFSKRYDAAVAQLKKTIALDTAFSPPHWYLARCYWMMGSLAESREAYVNAAKSAGDMETAALIERQQASDEPDAFIRDMLRNWADKVSDTGINAHDLAILNALAQNREETLKWLERSVEVRHPWAGSIDAEPEFDFVRDDPRFEKILRRMNLTH